MERIVRQRRAVLVALGVVALASLTVALLVGKQEWDGLLLNLGTEIVGGALTYGLFELFIGRAERIEEEKARLITQLGSDVRAVAVPAATELGRRGWLEDGSLRDARLFGANLSGAYLFAADLSGANLNGANLRAANLVRTVLLGASLRGANMSEVNLFGADLSAANLSNADLTGATLLGTILILADLFGVDLSGANLSGADLTGANLKGAKVTNEQLAQAKSIKSTMMPDGTEHDFGGTPSPWG